jgi:hypothetical protein
MSTSESVTVTVTVTVTLGIFSARRITRRLTPTPM